MTNSERYRLTIHTGSNNVYGWNGSVHDRQNGRRYPLIKTVVDYELHGEIGYMHCAFDTRDELLAAAKRKAQKLAGVRA